MPLLALSAKARLMVPVGSHEAIRAEPTAVSLALERAVPSQRGLPVLWRRCREAATQVPLTQPSVAQTTLGGRC